jgi:uncharacterized protein (TIGR03437 family)
MNKLYIRFAILIVVGTLHCVAQMKVVNAASFDAAQPIAPGSFVAAFGQNLCSQTMTGSLVAPGQLPVMLGGCSVTVADIPAMMQYVSPGQVNFVMPGGVASGKATVAVQNGSQMMTGTVMTAPAGPGMFALNGMGMGEGAMLNGDLWRTPPFSTTTNGHATVVAIYVTGMDISSRPTVTIGGVLANVVWYGDISGYPGLQQINITLPDGMSGVGRVPVMVTSNGQASNITFMHVLPTTSMMQGMPGWMQSMTVADNMPRGHELSHMAFNASNGTILVADENDDVVRVISMTSKSTVATITLPSGSQAHAVAVNAAGNLAAVGLSAIASVALIDLTQSKVTSVIGTGYYPGRLAFAGTNLLVTNGGSGTVSVIDSGSGTVTQTVNVALGACGIATAGTTAVVANMQAGSVSMINLSDYSVSTVALPEGMRPHHVAISAQSNKAVITTPMSNGFFILDLGTKVLTQVATNASNGMGPGAAAIDGNNIYIANQMTSNITVADLVSGSILQTFSVDPGPVALAVDHADSQLLILAEGTGTVDAVDLTTHSVVKRINGGDTERQGQFTMPLISSTTPTTASAGATFTLTIAGAGFETVHDVQFHLTGASGGMMGGGMGGMGGGMGQEDTNIKVSNVQVNPSGTQITASVQILPAATVGSRQIRLETTYGEVMGMMTNSLFAVTK